MLVGREAERAALEALCAGARVGQSGVLVLTGEAGIGKTALLEHALGQATGMRVLQAVGSGPEREVAFGGLLQLLRPTLELLELIPAPQADALAAALELRAGRPGERFATGAATLSLLSRAAEDQPLLLVVDDAHDLDGPSVDALVFAGRRLLTDPIVLLLATRTDREPDPLRGLPHLGLGGLDVDRASQLLRHGAAGPVTEDAVRRAHAATGGNPLAMLELVADLEALERIPPEVPVPVPEVLAASFDRRLARLPEPARGVLLLAAVADGDLAVVSAAAPAMAGRVEDLVAAEEAGLVSLAAGRVRFRHPLVRSGVYAAATAGQRRQAHLAVARALPAADLERRTWHLSEATLGFDGELARALEQVASRAGNRSAYSVAAVALERSASHTRDPDRRAVRLLAAGEQAWLAGQDGRALALADASTTLSEEPGLRAAADGLRGSVAAHSGSLEDARRLLTDAGRRLSGSEPAAAARLLGDAVMACLWMGDVTGAAAAAEVLDELDDDRLDERARVVVGMGVGMARVLAGDDGIDRIRQAVERLVASGETADDPRRPGSSLVGVLFLRESGTGRELLERSVRDLRSRTALAALPALLAQVARDETTTDRWRQGRSHYEESIALAREVGHTTELTMSLAGLAVVLARVGEEQACAEVLDEAQALAERHRVHLAQVWSLSARGDLALGLGRPEDALVHYGQLEATLERIGLHDVDLRPGPEQVDALVRTGQHESARTTAAAYHARATAKGQPWALARAERAVAVAADGLAEERFGAALHHHAETTDLYEEARTRLAFGAALRRARRRVDARPQLRAAVAAFERLGADPWADAAAAELAATGEAPSRRGGSVAERLTAQELQVSRMLAEGLTTRETAAALFLSPKTVEYHLRKVYTKLGIHSRDELAAALPREGDHRIASTGVRRDG